MESLLPQSRFVPGLDPGHAAEASCQAGAVTCHLLFLLVFLNPQWDFQLLRRDTEITASLCSPRILLLALGKYLLFDCCILVRAAFALEETYFYGLCLKADIFVRPNPDGPAVLGSC